MLGKSYVMFAVRYKIIIIIFKNAKIEIIIHVNSLTPVYSQGNRYLEQQ